jgi:hypothetical protein
MGILGWLLGGERADMQRIDQAVERIMAHHPHLRLAPRYRARLGPAVGTTLAYLDKLVASLPAPREASVTAWTSDPCIRAFFACADDVARVISRSADLRAHFEHNADAQQAYAVLGMEMRERHILGVGLEGDTLRRDVPQTTISFSDHQIRICGHSEAGLRNEIASRLLDQLALEGLTRVAADKSRRDLLERERALLKTRLQLLGRQGAGMSGMLGSDGPEQDDDLARLQTEVEDNERNLQDLGLKSDALERALECVREVFAEPERHIFVSSKRVRLDRMNVVLEQSGAQAGDDIEFHFARIPTAPPRTRAFALVRFARADLLPAKSMLDEAQRLLATGILS